MTERLPSPHDALRIAWSLATIRSYYALATVSHRVTYRVLEKLDVTAARASLARLVPATGAPAPAAAPAAARRQERTLAEIAGAMRPDGLAERALGLGVAFIDVSVAARTADLLGLVLALDGPNPHLAERLAETLPRLESARESLGRAIDRLVGALADELCSPAVREAAATLAEWVGEKPPRFDGADAAWTWRPGERWCSRIDEGMRRVLVALSFPADPGVRAPESAAERLLLEAILDHPDDDAPRLEWAGLAALRHDLRADLVRAQVKTRAERRAAPSRRAFEPEVAAFLIRTHPEWADDVRRLGAEQAAFHGGFVEDITISAEAFSKNAAALLRTAPIRRVRLTGVAPHLDALLSSGWLDRMLWLDLSGQGLDDRHAGALASAPGLGALRALSLDGNGITDLGVRALWASPSLGQLVYVGLEGNPCSSLETMELTPEEMSHYEWVATERALELRSALGPRRWAARWSDDWPPNLDVLAAM